MAKEVIANGGDVSFEWPRFCTGWKLDVITKFIERFKLLTVDFDGCSLGLKSKKGNPIKKPWRIVTTSQKLVDQLRPCVCANNHRHDICQGAETYKTGFYNEALARKIIVGLRPSPKFVTLHPPLAVSPCSGIG